MEATQEEIIFYSEKMSSPEPELLQDLHRETHMKVLYPRMLSDHYQGRFLSMLAKIHRPRRILEIGTFTGYSCICLAEGLAEGGEIHTLEMNAELDFIIRPFLKRAGIEEQVHVHYGMAIDSLKNLSGPFDMVFIDADKSNYLPYYHTIFDWVPSGGLILADNVLWDGKVVGEAYQDKETNGIRTFNEFVSNDERVERVFLPIRDGLFVLRKK
ncbi:MAG: O-methyltransferase [Bacteroidia bacterium]|nr:O-methyltransferase [Bacteroidia bacterium]